VVKMLARLVVVLMLVPAVLLAAPDMVLKDIDGKSRNVNEFIGKGQWTVVAIWSVDCPICRRELYQMAFLHDANRKKDATVLGISIDGMDDRKRVVEFIDEHALSFPNLIGSAKDAAELGTGRLFGTPTYYIFSPDGRLLGQRVGAQSQEQIEDLIAQLKRSSGG
jgi:peroxiredoxin